MSHLHGAIAFLTTTLNLSKPRWRGERTPPRCPSPPRSELPQLMLRNGQRDLNEYLENLERTHVKPIFSISLAERTRQDVRPL